MKNVGVIIVFLAVCTIAFNAFGGNTAKEVRAIIENNEGDVVEFVDSVEQCKGQKDCQLLYDILDFYFPDLSDEEFDILIMGILEKINENTLKIKINPILTPKIRKEKSDTTIVDRGNLVGEANPLPSPKVVKELLDNPYESKTMGPQPIPTP